MPEVIIRPAITDDLPMVLSLLDQMSMTWQPGMTPPTVSAKHLVAFEAIKSDPRQTLLVAEAEGVVAGSMSVVIVPALPYDGRPWAILENIVVAVDQRSKGYGESLVRYGIEMAKAAGCYKVSLTSNKQRLDAHRFYRRLGFTATHEGFRLDLAS